jgi:hypothetical protein
LAVVPSTSTCSDPGTYYGIDPITALRIYGTEIEFPLLAGQAVFTLGRSAHCDLRADLRYLAAVHVRIERVAHQDWLRVTDVSSGKNPIIFKSRRQQEFYMRPGDSFRIGKTVFYALGDEMRLARPTAMEVLGARHHAELDDLLIAAVLNADRHVVIIAEPGNDQERLGQAIHMASPRRRHLFKVIPPESGPGGISLQMVRDARGGTMLIWLPPKRRFDPTALAWMLAPEASLRLILCAPSIGKMNASFPPAVVGGAHEIAIASLRERTEEIPQLLDYWLVSIRSQLRFAALTASAQQKLRAYAWRGNLQELRVAADHLAQLAHFRSERQATSDTEITRSASRSWRKRLGLSLPLTTLPLTT